MHRFTLSLITLISFTFFSYKTNETEEIRKFQNLVKDDQM